MCYPGVAPSSEFGISAPLVYGGFCQQGVGGVINFLAGWQRAAWHLTKRKAGQCGLFCKSLGRESFCILCDWLVSKYKLSATEGGLSSSMALVCSNGDRSIFVVLVLVLGGHWEAVVSIFLISYGLIESILLPQGTRKRAAAFLSCPLIELFSFRFSFSLFCWREI